MPENPVSRTLLATWPTPLEAAPRLAAALGLHTDRLWLKRDDLTGVGAGGNKLRKLEWTVGAALAAGADTLITTGAAQSNHARLTAAAAARCGLDCVLVLAGAAPDQVSGNLVLDGLLGARIVWAGRADPGEDGQQRLDTAAAQVERELRADGRRPEVIPFGGSSAVGAHGYRLAGLEIAQQAPAVDHVVTALGSGGTMAGLVAALGADRVLGVDVGAVVDGCDRVQRMLADMGETVAPQALRTRGDQIGEGYATLPPATADALVLAARTEGLILDPVYSGRALAGLVAEVADGVVAPTDTVVLLVSGGLPGLFGSTAATALGGELALGS